MSTRSFPVSGSGLGLRRSLATEAIEQSPAAVDFWEIAPENWIGVGGQMGRALRTMTERHPFVCHGLSLSIGSTAPLDLELLKQIKTFLGTHGISAYTEHLSFCSDDGHLYDLMPIPFAADAVVHVAARVRAVQEILERRIALENISYYAATGHDLTELEFINAVLSEADCDLLLDVNNLFVNANNHAYDPRAFLRGLPRDRVVYGHIAGHFRESDNLRIDTHGTEVSEPVWDLLAFAYQEFGVFPTLLERDFDIPSLDRLTDEVARIAETQRPVKNVELNRHPEQDAVAIS